MFRHQLVVWLVFYSAAVALTPTEPIALTERDSAFMSCRMSSDLSSIRTSNIHVLHQCFVLLCDVALEPLLESLPAWFSLMPFVDSWCSAWGISGLFSSVESAATYCMSGNLQLLHDFDSSLSKSNMSYELGASSSARCWDGWWVHLIPKQTEADIWKVFPSSHIKGCLLRGVCV